MKFIQRCDRRYYLFTIKMLIFKYKAKSLWLKIKTWWLINKRKFGN